MKTSIWNKYLDLTREPTLWGKIANFLHRIAIEIIVAVIGGIVGILLTILLRC
jgi:hypothetical protein